MTAGGYRLYDIKHYKPTFRLHELEVFDGDFNDPVWLLIAKDNEDTPIFLNSVDSGVNM